MIKRKFIIRETDYQRYFVKDPSWHRKSWEPITVTWLQKQANWFTLKNNKKFSDLFRHWPYPHEILRRLGHKMLYKSEYINWLVNYNDQGEMQVRAGINQPLSRLGWAKLEADEEEDLMEIAFDNMQAEIDVLEQAIIDALPQVVEE